MFGFICECTTKLSDSGSTIGNQNDVRNRWPYPLTMILGMGMVILFGSPAFGERPDGSTAETKYLGELTKLPNMPMLTAGGGQLWTDYRNVFGWRIQQNALTGHWRLLDSNNVRQSWGTWEKCEKTLKSATQQEAEVQPPNHVIILLHGLMRTHRAVASLDRYLTANTDAHVIRFSYASTRFGIGKHAKALGGLVAHLPGTPRVDFVGHSMGNIVVRRAIWDWQQEGGDPKQVLPRLGRVVMLGPPNQGARIARRLGKLGLFETITGRGGMELGPDWDTLKDQLATPPCPFAIIAGDLPAKFPKNPLVDGSSDFVVSVEEARLKGATEFHTVAQLHSTMMDAPEIQGIVGKFLKK